MERLKCWPKAIVGFMASGAAREQSSVFLVVKHSKILFLI